MKAFLLDLFAYHHHFTPRLIDLVEKHQAQLPEKSIGLLSHILNAHQIWNARIQDAESGTVFRTHPFDHLRTMESDNHRNTLQILEERPLDERIRYANTKGQPFENSIQEILFHVANHTTHHRAQIASAVREIGGEPFPTDYIFYKR